jgi:hypothetical protein
MAPETKNKIATALNKIKFNNETNDAVSSNIISSYRVIGEQTGGKKIKYVLRKL